MCLDRALCFRQALRGDVVYHLVVATLACLVFLAKLAARDLVGYALTVRTRCFHDILLYHLILMWKPWNTGPQCTGDILWRCSLSCLRVHGRKIGDIYARGCLRFNIYR